MFTQYQYHTKLKWATKEPFLISMKSWLFNDGILISWCMKKNIPKTNWVVHHPLYQWYTSGIFPANWGIKNATNQTFYGNQHPNHWLYNPTPTVWSPNEFIWGPWCGPNLQMDGIRRVSAWEGRKGDGISRRNVVIHTVGLSKMKWLNQWLVYKLVRNMGT